MQQWLGADCPVADAFDEEGAWAKGQADFDSLLGQFREVRAEQIALFPKFNDTDWRTTREAVWGPVTLLWVVNKTYQHTAEHTSDIMRIALFWDDFENRQKAKGGG